MIHPVTQKLVEEVPVRAVNLDSIKSNVDRISSSLPELLDDRRELAGLQRARSFVVHHTVLFRRVHLAVDSDRTWRHGQLAVRLVVTVGRAPTMPNLEVEECTLVLHGLDNRTPSLHLLGSIHAGRARITMSVCRDERAFCDDQAAWGSALGVVLRRGRAWDFS